MKRVLGIISVVGVLGVTGWLIFSLLTNSGIIFPEGKPVPANMSNSGYWKIDFNYWKMEFSNTGFAKFFSSFAEDASHTKLEYPKIESEDPSPLNQPPAPPPPPSPTPTSLPPSPQPPPSPTPTSEPESSFSPLCDPFDGMKLSLMILSIREDIMVLPIYLRTHGEVISGLVPPPDDSKSADFHAQLGYVKSNSCGLQEGFENRLYCMFSVTPDMPGTLVDFYLYKDECEDPVFTQLNLSIPELRAPEDEKPQCKIDLEEGDCVAAGGTFSIEPTTGATICYCP